MRSKRKKLACMMFLLITILMFLHSWKLSLVPASSDNYAKKHLNVSAAQAVSHPLHQAVPVMVHA